MHYSAAPCEPAKTSAGCRATHQDVFTLTVHTNTSNSAASRGLTSAPSMTINYPVVITPRDGQQQGGPTLPLEDMVTDTIDAPIPIPFHPAAEATWRRHGLL